jgi:hypothetical protein
MKEILYHGSPKEFEEFDPMRMGERMTSLGLGYYLTPDPKLASDYGTHIMLFEVDTSNILDWQNLDIKQRAEIESELLKVIPSERIVGFGKKIQIKVKNDKEGLEKFNELQEKTKDYYHDSAKAKVVDSYENIIVIEYKQVNNLELANAQQLMTLMNEYHPNMINQLGYKGARFSNQVALYDASLAKKIDVKSKLRCDLSKYNLKEAITSSKFKK